MDTAIPILWTEFKPFYISVAVLIVLDLSFDNYLIKCDFTWYFLLGNLISTYFI